MVDLKTRETDTAVESKRNGHAASPAVDDIRKLIPPLGLREYWYPALEDSKVKSKPVGRIMLGEQLVFFRGIDGQVKALHNVCAHRGGSLMHGDCHYKGTISCPYHGWTYDGEGNVLAVLPEGPESQVPGKVKQRAYPTRTLKGMVFVWMGEGEPAPIEEDVPPEFFDDTSKILFATEYWPVNWQVSLENGGDAHVPYVHRDAIRSLLGPIWFVGPRGNRQVVANGRAVITPRSVGAGQGGLSRLLGRQYFPALKGYWPKHEWRKWWGWILAPHRRANAKRGPWETPEEWSGGHHLPGMYRGDYKTFFYTRQSVAVTESMSRQVYFKASRPKSRLAWWWERLHFNVWYRWTMFDNFSKQDYRAVAPQRYDTPEYLSATDTHQIVWRRLVLQARGMMQADEAAQIADTRAEEFSFERQREMGKAPDRVAPELKHRQ